VIQNEEYVLEILQDAGMITRSQAEAARQAAPGDAVDKLVEQGLLTQEDIAQTLAAQSGLEYVNDIHPRAARRNVPRALPHRRCAARTMQNPPKRLQRGDHQPAQDHDRLDEHRRESACRRTAASRCQCRRKVKPIDLRVSTIPTVHGESVVMRILDKSSLMLGLPELGFLSDDQAKFEQLITLPDGIMLVTGPTGSGKTTTLYACLNYINKPDRKIITVEDPVEYQMNGINQVQVNGRHRDDLSRGAALNPAPGAEHHHDR
jgi:flagellar biosynthesis GTPase FlhF